jgi:hypothetical protein
MFPHTYDLDGGPEGAEIGTNQCREFFDNKAATDSLCVTDLFYAVTAIASELLRHSL